MSFLVPELIRKKRDGEKLSPPEIRFLVEGFSNGKIPDYQVSAWLMASLLKGLDEKETLELTRAMKESGESLSWREADSSFSKALFADKHSTGGVGDKVSIILAPLASLLDLKIPMMSGRGLSFTGGTVDKLQSIPGFKMQLSHTDQIRCLKEASILMVSQSDALCPADKKLYSLRDVTATVESLPLITASIVSKKWAAGVENIVYDVKCGQGAFMRTPTQARELAKSLVKVSKLSGMRAKALITRMDEPLGTMIGNSAEVLESTWILKNSYPSPNHERIAKPLKNLCLRFAAEMACLSGSRKNVELTIAECEKLLINGSAFERFGKMLEVQGSSLKNLEKMESAPVKIPLSSVKSGYITNIDSRKLGLAGVTLKIGREAAEDPVDPAVAMEMAVCLGDKIEKGQPLLNFHLRHADIDQELREILISAFDIGPSPAGNLNPDLVIEEQL